MRISDWSSDVCSSDLAARDHLRRELGADGERAIRYLATADALLLEGHVRSHLRFAESAIYNLREAFDSIVGGSDPVGDDSDAVREAWERLKAGETLPDRTSAAWGKGVIAREATGG